MHIRNIGKSGLRVSSIGLGCNNFGMTVDAQQSKSIISAALDAGVTLFDTAPIYGAKWGLSESILGEALGAKRQQVTIVTKFGIMPTFVDRDTSRATILKDVETSLGRLKTDYIDLYMLHWPDVTTPMEETLRALDDLITAGKVRYIGCCNLPAWQVVEAKWIAQTGHLHEFIVSQDEYSLASSRAKETLIPALEKYGAGLMPYSPLANGLLTGKYTSDFQPADSRLTKNLWNMGDRYLTEEKLRLAQRLSDYAANHGHSLLQLAVSWLLAQPVVCSVIAGATKLEQLQTNVASGEWQLSAQQMADIEVICSDP